MVFADIFTGKYNFGVVPRWGIFTFKDPTAQFLYEWPALDRGAFAAFPE